MTDKLRRLSKPMRPIIKSFRTLDESAANYRFIIRNDDSLKYIVYALDSSEKVLFLIRFILMKITITNTAKRTNAIIPLLLRYFFSTQVAIVLCVVDRHCFFSIA